MAQRGRPRLRENNFKNGGLHEPPTVERPNSPPVAIDDPGVIPKREEGIMQEQAENPVELVEGSGNQLKFRANEQFSTLQFLEAIETAAEKHGFSFTHSNALTIFAGTVAISKILGRIDTTTLGIRLMWSPSFDKNDIVVVRT